MRSCKSVVVIALSVILFACGSDDACNRPLPYMNSQSGGELVIPQDLSAPDKSRLQVVPELSGAQQTRSNPCSSGPPELTVEPAAPRIAQTPAAAPVTTIKAPPLNIGAGFSSDSVEETLSAWVRSWAQADVPAYLSFYASDFRPESDATTRDIWLRRRQEMLLSSGPVDISIRNVSVEPIGAGRQLVRLNQDFTEAGATRSVVKVMEMSREGDAWRIRSERVVNIE